MNVLNLLHYSPEFGGGLAKHLLVLGERCKLRGHNLFLGFADNKYWHQDLVKFSEIVIIPEINYALRSRFRKIVLELCKNNSINILHIHFEFAQPFSLALSLKKWDIPTIYQWHNPPVPLNDFLTPQNKIFGKIQRIISGVVARFTDKKVINKHIAISKNISQLLIKNNWIKQDKLINLPNAVPSLEQYRGIRECISNQVPIIGMVANFRPEKDHITLLKAINILHMSDIQCELWLVGDGPTRARIENLVEELNIRSSVRFFGYLSDTNEIYNRIDIFVLSTQYEGHSLVLMEAMRFNLPIIATKVSSIPDIIMDHENGLLVNPGDAHDLARAMKEIILDPILYKKLSMGSQMLFKNQLTLEMWADQLISEYECLVNNKNSSN